MKERETEKQEESRKNNTQPNPQNKTKPNNLQAKPKPSAWHSTWNIYFWSCRLSWEHHLSNYLCSWTCCSINKPGEEGYLSLHTQCFGKELKAEQWQFCLVRKEPQIQQKRAFLLCPSVLSQILLQQGKAKSAASWFKCNCFPIKQSTETVEPQ